MRTPYKKPEPPYSVEGQGVFFQKTKKEGKSNTPRVSQEKKNLPLHDGGGKRKKINPLGVWKV